ncbi:hypothetical protein IAU60_004076 [Kwoniella sp. DSM 27419]
MPSKWVPLEASPDWSQPIGLPESLTFQDLFSLDPDFLQYVPAPHRAVLLLFPTEGKLGELRREEEKAYREKGGWKGQGVWYIRQTIPNACGSIGLLHSLLNLPEQSQDSLSPDSQLAKFKAACTALSPVERAKLLDEADFFTAAHTAAAQSGQSAIPEDLENVDNHFIAFVEGYDENGEKRIVELDGTRAGPYDQGPSTDFLEDVAKVVQEQYIDRADGDLNFSMIVLAGQPQE